MTHPTPTMPTRDELLAAKIVNMTAKEFKLLMLKNANRESNEKEIKTLQSHDCIDKLLDLLLDGRMVMVPNVMTEAMDKAWHTTLFETMNVRQSYTAMIKATYIAPEEGE